MHYLQRCSLLLLLTLFVTLPAAAQQSKKISETVPLQANGRVLIDTYKGSIEVTTWDRDEVAIDAVIEADENRELVPLTEVRIRRTGSTVQIESDYSKTKKRGGNWKLFGNNNLSLPFVHYVIRMPRTAELGIDDYKSEIDVADLVADLEIETYKGNARLRNIRGDVGVETYKGDVEILALTGGLDAETYKGNIEVEFTELAGRTMIDTYRGDVRLRIPGNAGFDLNANLGRGGDLDTDFSLANVDIDDNEYRGEVGGGGPRLEVDTYKGRVQLAAR